MKLIKKSPWAFIILIGIISLFSDMTHEGARSITGPYLAMLGASATIVGFVAGFGELIGYSLRLVSGFIADKTKKYWTVTFIGYFINLLAVPALALAGSWQMAAVLMILERMGRAIRNPARDTMLSHATSAVGHGKGFGIHEALDQIGAVTGPLIVGAVYYFSGSYHKSFAILLIPAIIAISILIVARMVYPDTKDMETKAAPVQQTHFKQFYWIYLIAVSLIAAGFADYPLIAFHFNKTSQVSSEWIPVMFAIAMGVDALAALILGKLFDKHGMKSLILSTVFSAAFAPLVFMGNFYTAMLGMICWGVGMAAQESVMRAVLATILPIEKRATGFGIFNAVFGLFWFLGSFLMGWLYDVSISGLIVFSVGMQVISLPFFMRLSINISKNKPILK
ncbi:MAG: MFS transporter [Bacteroidetes bacterium GWD2_45_23]|nr:MAG: MFS transporter [Bacteroidetes bacterium GWC2_46_850]OFX74568.1 MAG: MFS transporter [Bacteroidetes bacterium GWC1_47_7]OFX82709.1 MAG: MFS transporter [Bacteroidetes bacterium GWD2_45_23]HAR39398.1 MFS transporter [Porphyromonadaceae bacterium]HBB02003.1 MFS transporter [Porphyromonadaceae bacterium]